MRKNFRRRAAIEPLIGHLKSDFRLSRNYYKGITGDNINVMLAASAMNFKRMMNKWKENPLLTFFVHFFVRNFTPILTFLLGKTQSFGLKPTF